MLLCLLAVSLKGPGGLLKSARSKVWVLANCFWVLESITYSEMRPIIIKQMITNIKIAIVPNNLISDARI